MNKLTIIIIVIALCIGLFGGIFIEHTGVFADTAFWSGTANGNIVPVGTMIPQSPATLIIAPDAIGPITYPNGTVIDLKNLQVGQTTTVTLYVRNNTKKIVNVYPLVTSTPNIEVLIPISNSKMYPNGWTQFLFQVKALSIGNCSVCIKFAKND
jgi:hypothetical protein